MSVRCQKCRKGKMRQQVSIFAETDADSFSLCKKSIRKANVTILGVDWGNATIYCDAGCGNVLWLNPKRATAE